MPKLRLGLRLPCAAHCLFLLVPVLPLGALAQSEIETVVITGTREPQPLTRSTADLVVIDYATIRDTTADSVEELLRREAGIQSVRNGGPGQSSGYFLRGANSSGTLVLVDGIRVGSATLGQAEFESLSLAQIDHIEVLRGPASSLYGADAVGGVVQIFTRRGAGALRITGHGAVGGYNSQQGDLGISGSQGTFDYAASAGIERSDGVSAVRPNDQFGNFNPDDDGYNRKFGQLNLGFTPAAGHRIGVTLMESKLNSQYDSAEFNAPDFLPDPSPDFRNHLTTDLAALDYRGAVSSLWTTTLQISKNVDDSKSGGTTLTRFKSDRDQATWQNALHITADQQVMLAYEYLHESVQADGFAGTPKRSNNALVAGYSVNLGSFNAEASVRHDDNTAYGDNTTGNLGASYRLTPEFKLRALGGTTFRAPTFNDLYYPGYGVSTIQPERGKSIEFGAEWRSAATMASATVYRNDVENLIGYQPDATLCPPDPAYAFGCAGNTSRARLKGATLTGAQTWDRLSVRAVVDFLDAKDRDTDVRLPRRAAHQETLTLDYNAEVWSLGGSIVDIGSRPDNGAELPEYAVVDLRATWKFLPHWRVEASLLNALDQRVEPVRDYQGLGRQAWIGVRYDGAGF